MKTSTHQINIRYQLKSTTKNLIGIITDPIRFAVRSLSKNVEKKRKKLRRNRDKKFCSHAAVITDRNGFIFIRNENGSFSGYDKNRKPHILKDSEEVFQIARKQNVMILYADGQKYERKEK